uniref:SREBP regulating gene protein n=1 Tax=Cyprinus carpio TaxID=7962 RepID=A0A8C1ZLT4_CYPCA
VACILTLSCETGDVVEAEVQLSASSDGERCWRLAVSTRESCWSRYVCERKDLLVNGCCNVNAPSSSQHVCKSCLANGCCSIYEYCVSCCLQPDKQPLLERFLNRAAEGFQNLFTAVEDHFELCLAKCRTSSQVSVTL